MIIESPSSHLHFGIHWEASDWYDRDYIGFMLLQRMLGDFERQEFHDSLDYNSEDLAGQILKRKFIKKFETVFLPYKNTGLFGVAVQVEDN